jgi:GST-like protein
MFGQFGHFYKYAPEKIPYAIDRYTNEAKRLLKVLDTRLEGQQYLVGEQYTIADISIFPWVNCLSKFYAADEQLGLADYKNVNAWLERCLARPAVEVSVWKV